MLIICTSYEKVSDNATAKVDLCVSFADRGLLSQVLTCILHSTRTVIDQGFVQNGDHLLNVIRKR